MFRSSVPEISADVRQIIRDIRSGLTSHPVPDPADGPERAVVMDDEAWAAHKKRIAKIAKERAKARKSGKAVGSART